MNRQCIFKDNKGASLVMVLLAMMFIGIIAAIVLTITVGNTKSTNTTVDSSSNFYSSESVFDDFKMFLKKKATAAASQAFANSMEDVENLEENYHKNFRTEFIKLMQNTDKSGVCDRFATVDAVDSTKMVLDESFIKDNITYNRTEDITIKFNKNSFIEEPEEDTDPIEIKDIEITFVDAKGYETRLTANLTLQAQLPEFNTMDSSGDFTYGIDHFVMISGKNINPGSTGYMSGNITGSVYALNNFNVKTMTPKTVGEAATEAKCINLKSEYVLVGGDINVRGRMSVQPIDGKDIVTNGDNDSVATELWAGNMRLSGVDSKVVTNKVGDLATSVFLSGNLELNGDESEYKANGGDLVAYSSDGSATIESKSSDIKRPKSSAIILNGLGAKLDLENLDTDDDDYGLQIFGQAYTILPNLDGVTGYYDYYSGNQGSAEPLDVNYYTQGESITYRAVQALYLVPGSYIKGVGHNPMKESEFNSIKTSDGKSVKSEYLTAIPADIGNLLNSGKVRAHHVRYMNKDGGSTNYESYVYLFWDFSSADKAVTYFNAVLADTTNTKYSGLDLVKKQAGILGKNDGYIKLPSTINAVGNSIKYDSANKFRYAGKNTSDLSGDDFAGYKKGLLASLQKSDSINEANLPKNMFKDLNGESWTQIASEDFNSIRDGVTLYGPLEYVDGNKKAHSYTGTCTQPERKYALITGPNVTLSTLGDYTYIIITPGNVNITATGDFRGMIIAGGDITIPDGLNMECLGNISYTETINGTAGNTYGADEPYSEFQALLGVSTGDKPTLANYKLRKIFGIQDTSTHVGGDNDGELVKFYIEEYKVN